MIDARRMEVYTAIYDNNLEPVETLKAIVVNEESFKEYKGKQIFYFGDGASKCTSLFDHNNKLTFLQNIQLSAEAIGKLAEVDFASNTFADVVYCEPFYLKEFIAGKPRVKGLTD
jgi:tRNA threonylcarbamoyladenosine biosynthesis protein TsaB